MKSPFFRAFPPMGSRATLLRSFHHRAARQWSPPPLLGEQPRLPLELMDAMETKAKKSQALLTYLKHHADAKVASVTVQTTLGGMRGARLLLCETSTVDPYTGLAYRGYPVESLLTQLPAYSTGSRVSAATHAIPSSEAVLWLLLTGSIPTVKQVELLRATLVSRMVLPEYVRAAVEALPAETHPMTQLITGIAACQTESAFRKMYATGLVPKSDHWRFALEDGLSVIAKLPLLASLVYRRVSGESQFTTTGGKTKRLAAPASPEPTADWSANIACLMGFDHPDMAAVLRLYMFLHADHEGGNVSAHAAHLVGSALADPYLAYAASMAGLAGPLHGLANQQCLQFFRRMHAELPEPTPDSVKSYIEKNILEKGQVVPGFGHAVLRVTDPRFTIQYKFAQKMLPENGLFKLLNLCLSVVPPLLKSTGKVANPYPNIDAHSGIILNHYGLREETFFTVLFGVSRCIGIMSQIVWDRLLNLPIERPKSVTLEELRYMISEN